MNDFEKLINASDLIEWIMEAYPDWCVGAVRSIVDHVNDMPSAEAEPVKHGKWIVEHGVLYGHGKDVHYGDLWHCSECGRRELDVEGWDYCPNCGAKMGERREDGDGDG